MHAISHCPHLPELKRIAPDVHTDARGCFFETFRQRDFDTAIGQHVAFVQDNHSHSKRGVLRGLHAQHARHAQGKLVRVVRGTIFDVAVDVRRDSPTFGRWAALTLSEHNRWQHWIPAGYAHGFLVLSDAADVLYKTTDYWTPECEVTYAWNDPAFAIAWPLDGLLDGLLDGQPLLSDKDRATAQLR